MQTVKESMSNDYDAGAHPSMSNDYDAGAHPSKLLLPPTSYFGPVARARWPGKRTGFTPCGAIARDARPSPIRRSICSAKGNMILLEGCLAKIERGKIYAHPQAMFIYIYIYI